MIRLILILLLILVVSYQQIQVSSISNTQEDMIIEMDDRLEELERWKLLHGDSSG